MDRCELSLDMQKRQGCCNVTCRMENIGVLSTVWCTGEKGAAQDAEAGTFTASPPDFPQGGPSPVHLIRRAVLTCLVR